MTSTEEQPGPSPYRAPAAPSGEPAADPRRGRVTRLILGAVLPPLSGTLLLALLALPTSGVRAVMFFISGLPIAFIMVGLQSVVYSLLMEFVVLRKLRGALPVVGTSVLLGGLSGAVAPFGAGALALFPVVVGLFSGLVTGIVLREHFRRGM